MTTGSATWWLRQTMGHSKPPVLRDGAYQLRMENNIGSIEAGKLADLVILNDNLFDIDSDKIWKVKPAAVLMEGEVIQGQLPAEGHN